MENNQKSAIKKIALRIESEGIGVVNFNGNQPEFGYQINALTGRHYDTNNKNISYAKRNFYKNENSDDDSQLYKEVLKISGDTFRGAMFYDYPNYKPAQMSYNEQLMLRNVASPMYIIRGGMYTFRSEKSASITRKSPLCITCAEDITGAYINCDTHIKLAERDDTSLFYRDSTGSVKYRNYGFIDIAGFQFMNADPCATASLKSDWLDVKKNESESLIESVYKKLYKRVPFKTGHFTYNTDYNNHLTCMYGIKFDDEFVKSMIKQTLLRILQINISKATAFMKTTSLKIKMISEYANTGIFNDSNWIELKTPEDIENLDFDIFDFYSEAPDEVIKLYKDSAEIHKQIMIESKTKKTEEKERKKQERERKKKEKEEQKLI